MVKTVKFLYCDNEHGFGDVMFPDVNASDLDLKLVEGSARTLRKLARGEGWRFWHGRDYCPNCVSCELEREP